MTATPLTISAVRDLAALASSVTGSRHWVAVNTPSNIDVWRRTEHGGKWAIALAISPARAGCELAHIIARALDSEVEAERRLAI